MNNSATTEEILIGVAIIIIGLVAPVYLYLKKRKLLKQKTYIFYLTVEVLACIGLGLQFIFRINP